MATQETELLTVVTFMGEVEQLTELISEFHAELAALSALATTQRSLNQSALIQHVRFQSPLKKLHSPLN